MKVAFLLLSSAWSAGGTPVIYSAPSIEPTVASVPAAGAAAPGAVAPTPGTPTPGAGAPVTGGAPIVSAPAHGAPIVHGTPGCCGPANAGMVYGQPIVAPQAGFFGRFFRGPVGGDCGCCPTPCCDPCAGAAAGGANGGNGAAPAEAAADAAGGRRHFLARHPLFGRFFRKRGAAAAADGNGNGNGNGNGAQATGGCCDPCGTPCCASPCCGPIAGGIGGCCGAPVGGHIPYGGAGCCGGACPGGYPGVIGGHGTYSGVIGGPSTYPGVTPGTVVPPGTGTTPPRKMPEPPKGGTPSKENTPPANPGTPGAGNPASSPITPASGRQTETEGRNPFDFDRRYDKRVGRAADNSQLTGQLSFVHADGGLWILRFAPLSKEEVYGGSVILAQDRRLTSYREGDLVTVHGKVIAERGSSRLGGPLYRIRSIELVERPRH